MANRKKLQELYSKVCVAGSVISEEREEEERDLEVDEIFSCNLATILARDHEVVAVRLKLFSDKCVVYISKNERWEKEDTEYIKKIKEYLKSISRNAPIPLDTAFKRNDLKVLFKTVKRYCLAKFETRLEKLKKDLVGESQNPHILSFKEFANINDVIEVRGYKISGICSRYYKTVKDKPEIPKKFLRHLKKVGSYYSALVDITACACNVKYKNQFSNMDVVTLKPVSINRQPIFSWANIIQKFVHVTKEYEKFKKRCLDDDDTLKKLKEVYKTDTNGNPQLDSEKIEQRLCLHAEMNTLTNIIDSKDKKPTFIAVSKYCCYLCELYIKFANTKGYNIFTSGAHNKLYHKWVLPDTKDVTLKNDALKYMIAELDRIIRKELREKHIDIRARSDSEGESVDSDNAKHIDHSEVDDLMEDSDN
ncbi:18387_t:CDS:1 [Funneliformis geosporum]|nr:18387_t:CDS:1 [Funneliformis geosporum]